MSKKDSSPNVRTDLVYAHYADPKLSQISGRLTFYAIPNLASKDELGSVTCHSCQKNIQLCAKDIKESDRFWCNEACYKKDPWEFPKIVDAPKSSASQKGDQVCPHCNGPARGRGYAHTEECSEVQKKNEKRFCPECNGPAKGRGFNHIGECTLKTQPYIPKGERDEDSADEEGFDTESTEN